LGLIHVNERAGMKEGREELRKEEKDDDDPIMF
jgi:hypothetical protein